MLEALGQRQQADRLQFAGLLQSWNNQQKRYEIAQYSAYILINTFLNHDLIEL